MNVTSLNVQRVSVPSAVSIEYASPGLFTDDKVNPISREPGLQRTCDTVPAGTAGSARGLSVVRSSSCSSP